LALLANAQTKAAAKATDFSIVELQAGDDDEERKTAFQT
jgi:hypothetical protein